MTTVTVAYNELPVVENIEVYEGDTYRQPYTFSLQQDSGTAALDLTDASLTLRVSDERGGTAKTLSADSIVTIDAAASGQFTVVIAAADTESWGAGTYYYEVVCQFPADHTIFPSDVKTLLEGILVIREDAVSG